MAATAPNMGLKVWNLLTDPYDHSQLASNWAKVDQHDHTTGKGVQIPTGGLADGAVSTAKIGSEQVTAEKLASAVSEAGAFNTGTRVYRRVIATEETYSNSTTSYTTIDSGVIYVPKNGRIFVTYQAAGKATTSTASFQMFVDGNEVKIPTAAGLAAAAAATLEVSTFYGPVSTGVTSGALSITKGTAEYGTTTTGTVAPYQTSLFGFATGNHIVEIKAKAGAAGTIQVKNRNLWLESRSYE